MLNINSFFSGLIEVIFNLVGYVVNIILTPFNLLIILVFMYYWK